MQKVKLNISGMSCVNCSNAVERVALKIDGVSSAKVNFANGIGEFEVKDDEILQTLKAKIKKLGYDIAFNIEEFEEKQRLYVLSLRNNFMSALIISCIIMSLEMFFNQTIIINTIMILLAIFAIFYNGKMFFSHAIGSLKNKNYDMNVLVALGSLSALFHSVFVIIFKDLLPNNLTHIYVGGATMIITFVLLGKFLEERSKAKAGDYLKTLMDMSAKTATIIKPDGQNEEIPIANLKINDIVIVKNGYNIPSDGVVIQGGAEIDTSTLTGESIPKYHGIGDTVYAGTTNTNGHVIIKITKLSNQTLLSQILALLSDATTKKMPVSRLADKVANVFVPIVITLSIITFTIWAMITQNYTYAIINAINVLIISCPCALGLATPIAIISSLSRGAKGGILVKNPEVIEIIKDVKFAIFDKTGTLSKGEISVSYSNLDENELSLAASVENLSEHPISKAIVKFAKDKNIAILNLKGEFKNHLGLGITYKDDKNTVIIGNKKLLENFNITVPNQEIDQLQDIQSFIYYAKNDEFIGTIGISDELKDDAIQSIQELKKYNITPIIISGDNEKSVKTVAQKLEIDEFYANTMPNEKLDILKNIQSKGKVLFVGDGINDSLCLKQSDVSIAMNSGSDIAKSSGDIVLIKNQLKDVIFTLKLAKKTMKTIKQNLFWAFIYNLICIPIAAGVLYPPFGLLLSPMYAAFAMCFSSINVVLNSIRLKFVKF
ncbi:copper-translocating P-type ATPase [Campylobacter pinnipediorum subsp. pinnipediorum]|uniref:heavy metal translocating P-type ATPase n=1 Tax=Campylobacter pinnipediorum TaxID=1965231 RepID=UPI000995005E|nr:heavy metal translocating P-type ATPase [Campylobacter pinnipediorum]OPA78067.1 copper-translocating P-type ATPase [Campylobacter pinnipediorum subsp. pinnipediorum]